MGTRVGPLGEAGIRMLRTTAVLAGSAFAWLAPLAVAAQDAPLRLEISENEYAPRLRDIRLVAPGDGYLMVLHVTGGQARVMFPAKVGGSSAIARGDYTLDRLDVNVPYVFGKGGGIIVAAWSPSRIRTEDFVRYGHWAVSNLDRGGFSADPAVATIKLATQLGATGGAVAAVEYGSIRTAPHEMISHTYVRDPTDNYQWRVYQNLVRIQGPLPCPAGTRDVTGAGESCSSSADSRRSAPRARPVQEREPPYVPPRPLQAPDAIRSSPSTPPAASRPPNPPAPEAKPSKRPL
jgi:hypothetical protein